MSALPRIVKQAALRAAIDIRFYIVVVAKIIHYMNFEPAAPNYTVNDQKTVLWASAPSGTISKRAWEYATCNCDKWKLQSPQGLIQSHRIASRARLSS